MGFLKARHFVERKFMGSVPGDRLTCRKVEAHASAKLERKVFKIITKFIYSEAKIFEKKLL